MSKVGVNIRLKGHKGVLFDIDWDVHGVKLISVSDDRTLRCWELKYANSIKKTINDMGAVFAILLEN